MATQKQYKYTLPIGYRLKGGENDYVIEEVLGKGGFGVTYKVKATIFVNKISFDVHFAVKEYFPDICSRMDDNATIKIPETKQDEITDGIRDFLNEGRKLQQVCDLNPNIVNVNELFQANGTAYYVLEYLEGGDLRKMVKNGGKPLTEQQMLEVMTPIGRAVQCLHENNILHLDIKPANIVMRRKNDGTEEPVLIDFGIAVHFGNDGMPTSKTPSQGISPGYSPIEQYSPVKKFEPRIDIYAFAATCLYLLTGKDPMEAFDMTPETLRSEIPQTISPHIAQALIHAMNKDKHDRTSSVDEMIREMKTVADESVASPKATINLDPQQNKAASSSEPKVTSVNNSSQSSSKDNTASKKNLRKKILIGAAILLSLGLIALLIAFLNKPIESMTSGSASVESVQSVSPQDSTISIPVNERTPSDTVSSIENKDHQKVKSGDAKKDINKKNDEANKNNTQNNKDVADPQKNISPDDARKFEEQIKSLEEKYENYYKDKGAEELKKFREARDSINR